MKEDYYGDRFKADREAFARQLRDDVQKMSPLGKVLFVVQSRAMFFGSLSLWPEAMKAPLETAIGKFIFDLPFAMEDTRPSTADFPIALELLASGGITIDDDRAKVLIDILNIGAKP